MCLTVYRASGWALVKTGSNKLQSNSSRVMPKVIKDGVRKFPAKQVSRSLMKMIVARSKPSFG
ncbi:hypothetical protein GCM10023229_34830 [Flavisolibacter ginsenosidimutans]